MQQHGRSVGHIRDLVDLALGGDPEGRRLIRESGRHIGEVLAGAVNLLNPDALVIAGDMSKAYDILVADLRETVYGNATALATRELQILPSTHGDQSGVIGSAAMILDHVLSARNRCRALMTSVLPNFGAADPTVNGGEPTSNAEPRPDEVLAVACVRASATVFDGSADEFEASGVGYPSCYAVVGDQQRTST